MSLHSLSPLFLSTVVVLTRTSSLQPKKVSGNRMREILGRHPGYVGRRSFVKPPAAAQFTGIHEPFHISPHSSTFHVKLMTLRWVWGKMLSCFLWTGDRSCIEFLNSLDSQHFERLQLLDVHFQGQHAATLPALRGHSPGLLGHEGKDSQLGFSSETSKSRIVSVEICWTSKVRWMLHTSLQDMFTTCSQCIELWTIWTMAGLLSWRCRNCPGIWWRFHGSADHVFFCFSGQRQISLELFCLALLRPGLQTSCWKPRQVWV